MHSSSLVNVTVGLVRVLGSESVCRSALRFDMLNAKLMSFNFTTELRLTCCNGCRLLNSCGQSFSPVRAGAYIKHKGILSRWWRCCAVSDSMLVLVELFVLRVITCSCCLIASCVYTTDRSLQYYRSTRSRI